MGHFETLTKNITVYKKVNALSSANLITGEVQYFRFVVAKLTIPVGTKVYISEGIFLTNRKCRAKMAIVEGFYSARNLHAFKTKPGNKLKLRCAHSMHDPNFVYRVGNTVYPKNKFSNRRDTCAGGIHFFFSFRDAAMYGG